MAAVRTEINPAKHEQNIFSRKSGGIVADRAIRERNSCYNTIVTTTQQPPTGNETMPTATRTVALTDAARLKTALTDAGVRVAVQIDGDDAQLIYLADDAQAAADAIAAELSR